MKRLLGLLGLTCLVVLTACFYFGTLVSCVIAVLAIVCFVVTFSIKKLRNKKNLPTLFLTAFLAVSLFMGYTHLYINPLQNAYDDKTLSVRGIRISDSYYSYGYYCYELKCTEIGGAYADCKLLLRSKEAIFSEIGDELRFSAELDFGTDNIAPSERIFLQTWVPRGHNIEVIKSENRNLRYHISNLRNSLKNSIYLEMDYDTANFSSAVLLGNSHSLSPEVKGLLRTAGLSHIVVVSGLHLSVIGLLISKSFSKILKNKYLSSVLSIVSVTFFAVICGMGMPVTRALIMFIIYTVGTMFDRQSDSLNSIGAAALLLTITNPYSVGDIGMLLSFSATLGIVLWAGKLYSNIVEKTDKIPVFTRFSFVNKFLKGLLRVVSCNLCATLWTLPISMLVFKGFSVISLVVNLIVVPFMSTILLCLGLCVATHYISFLSVLTDVLSFIVSFFYDYLIAVCKFFTKLPFAYINSNKPYYVVWIVFTIILVLIASVIKKKFVRVLSVLLSILFLFSSSVVYHVVYRDTLTLYVPYTSSGVSVVLESSDGYAVLGASGSAFHYYKLPKIIETVNSSGNDVLISLPGFNSEIYSTDLINEFDYSTVLRYDINNKDNSPLCDEEVTFETDFHVSLWDKAYVSLIPCKDRVFVHIEAGDYKVLIVPRYSDCSLLSEEYLKVDAVISQGKVKNGDLLEFDTLIAPGDGRYDDESMAHLVSCVDNVVRGNDIEYNFNFR